MMILSHIVKPGIISIQVEIFQIIYRLCVYLSYAMKEKGVWQNMVTLSHLSYFIFVIVDGYLKAHILPTNESLKLINRIWKQSKLKTRRQQSIFLNTSISFWFLLDMQYYLWKRDKANVTTQWKNLQHLIMALHIVWIDWVHALFNKQFAQR